MASSVWSADLSAIDGIDNSFDVQSGSASLSLSNNGGSAPPGQQQMRSTRKVASPSLAVVSGPTSTNNSMPRRTETTNFVPSRSTLLSEAYLTKVVVRPALSFTSSSAGSVPSVHSGPSGHGSSSEGPVGGPGSVQQLSSISNNTSNSVRLSPEQATYALQPSLTPSSRVPQVPEHHDAAHRHHASAAQIEGRDGRGSLPGHSAAHASSQDLDALVDSALMHMPAHGRRGGGRQQAEERAVPGSAQAPTGMILSALHGGNRAVGSRAESEPASAYSRQSVPPSPSARGPSGSAGLSSPSHTGTLEAVPLPLPDAGAGQGSQTQAGASTLLKSLLPVSPAMDSHRLLSVISALAVAYRQLELVSTHRANELNNAKADLDSAIGEMQALQLQVAEAAELNGFIRHAFEQLQSQWEATGSPFSAANSNGHGTGAKSSSVLQAALSLPSLSILRGEALQIAAQRLKENRAEIASLSQQLQHATSALKDAHVWQGAGAAGLRAEIDRLNQQVAAAAALAAARTNQADSKVAEAVRLAQLAQQEKASAEVARADALAQLQAEKQSNSQLRSLLTSASVREDELKQRLGWAEEAIDVLKAEIRERDALLSQQMQAWEAVQATGALPSSTLQAILQEQGTYRQHQQHVSMLQSSAPTAAGDPTTGGVTNLSDSLGQRLGSHELSQSIQQDISSSSNAATTSVLLGRSAASSVPMRAQGASDLALAEGHHDDTPHRNAAAVHEVQQQALAGRSERPPSPAQSVDTETGSLTEETLAAAIEQAKAQARAVALAQAQEQERIRLDQMRQQQEYVSSMYTGPDCHCGPGSLPVPASGQGQAQGEGRVTQRLMRPVRVTGTALDSMELMGHTLQDVLEQQEVASKASVPVQLHSSAVEPLGRSRAPLDACASLDDGLCPPQPPQQDAAEQSEYGNDEGEWVDMEPSFGHPDQPGEDLPGSERASAEMQTSHEERSRQANQSLDEQGELEGEREGQGGSGGVKRVGSAGGPPGGSDSDLMLDASSA